MIMHHGRYSQQHGNDMLGMEPLPETEFRNPVASIKARADSKGVMCFCYSKDRSCKLHGIGVFHFRI